MTYQKYKGGRPTKRTVAVVRKLEQAFALGCNVTEAAYYASISRDTLHSWLRDDEQFSDTMERHKARPVLKARQTVIKNLNNVKVAMWFLERRLRDEFGRDAAPQADSEPRSIADLVEKLGFNASEHAKSAS